MPARVHPDQLLWQRPTAGPVPPFVRPRPRPPFTDILCAVDGSRGSAEAVRQAIAIGGSQASLTFVAVERQRGVGPAAEALLARATGHELLAIGTHGDSRLGGTATHLAHRAERPLLVARRTSAAEDFPTAILLASDGSPGSWAAARTATALSRSRNCELRLVHVPDDTHPERYREVLKQLTTIEKAAGTSPAIVDDPGGVAEGILETAHARQSSLIVLGRRGLSGVGGLGSVSERVVHRAPCSVLVVPPRADVA